tara:strand:- start:128 stop:382 length:255 start_codon:yes stop_codon:yes gene_type:complete
MFETANLVNGLIFMAVVTVYVVQKLINANRDNLLEIKELRDRVFKLEDQLERHTLKGLQRQIDRLHELRDGAQENDLYRDTRLD